LQQQQRQGNVQKRALHVQSCFFAEYFVYKISDGWAPTWWTETNKNICYRVLVQKSEFIPRGTHIHMRWLRIINEEGFLVIMCNCLIHIFSSSRCRRRLALNYYIFLVNNRYINESLAFSTG